MTKTTKQAVLWIMALSTMMAMVGIVLLVWLQFPDTRMSRAVATLFVCLMTPYLLKRFDRFIATLI